MIWNGVSAIGLEEGDVEYWVNEVECLRELKTISMGRDDFSDFVWAQSSLIKFLGGSLRCNILGIKPYQITDTEFWCHLATLIGRALILALGDGELLLAVLVEERQRL